MGQTKIQTYQAKKLYKTVDLNMKICDLTFSKVGYYLENYIFPAIAVRELGPNVLLFPP